MSLAPPALAGKLFTTNANCKVKPINLCQATYFPVWFNVDHIFVIVLVFFFLLACICLYNSVLIYFKSNSSSPNWRGICAKTGFPWRLHSKESACNAGDPGSNPEWEDPLEEEMAIHSSILAWEVWWTEEPSGPQNVGSQRVRRDLVTQLPPLPVPQRILPTTWATLSRLDFSLCCQIEA